MKRRGFSQKIIGILLGLLLLFSMSVPSYAQGVLGFLPLAALTPLQDKKVSYGLDLSQAVVRCNATAKQEESRPLAVMDSQQQMSFHPGDVLLIPVSKGSYNENEFVPEAGFYSGKGVPANWQISVTRQSDSVEEIRWYLGQETAAENALYVMLVLRQSLPSTQCLTVECEIALQDTTAHTSSNPIHLQGGLANVTRNLSGNALNQVLSPMNLAAGADYKGEKFSLSFGDAVLFRDTTMQAEQRMYLNLDRSFDNRLASQLKRFDLEFYHFVGESDRFATPGRLCLPAESQEACVYEINPNAAPSAIPERLPAVYDEENGCLSITTDHLGYYVVSNSQW